MRYNDSGGEEIAGLLVLIGVKARFLARMA